MNTHTRQFRCCFCLHVRTGTILLGFIHILLHLVVISCLLFATFRPDLLSASQLNGNAKTNLAGRPHSDIFSLLLRFVPGITDFQDTRASLANLKKNGTSDVATSLSSSEERSVLHSPHHFDLNFAHYPSLKKVDGEKEPVDSTNSQRIWYGPSRAYRHQLNPYFALCLSSFSLAFCYLLAHGAITRQPSHLLPFFCLQVFDFVVALLSVIGYLSSTSDLRSWLLHRSFPFKEIVLRFNPASMTLFVISVSCLIMAFKAYCIGMVWDCYRYLMLTNRTVRGDLRNRLFARLLPLSVFGNLTTFYGNTGRGHQGSASSREHFAADGLCPDCGNLLTDDHNCTPTAGVTSSALLLEQQTDDLPKYEEALKIPVNAYAPPPYFKTKKQQSMDADTEGQSSSQSPTDSKSSPQPDTT